MCSKLKFRNRSLFLVLGSLFIVSLLSGCVVRTYKMTKDRIDQDLSAGNRGYLKGQMPAGEEKERKATRTTQVVEIELRSPVRFEKMQEKGSQPQTAKPKAAEKEEAEGNKGYITSNAASGITEPEAQSFEKYTVQKNDTLQKISQKFYGTSKKWPKIYEANKDVLKGPDKVYPGQSLRIPVVASPKGNLK